MPDGRHHWGFCSGKLPNTALYAGDPSSADSSMIGGNVANNAGGNKAVKYGTTRHQIYSLGKSSRRLGDIFDAGARLKKSSTGLPEQLFAGSEGLWGIIHKLYVCLSFLIKLHLFFLIFIKYRQFYVKNLKL